MSATVQDVPRLKDDLRSPAIMGGVAFLLLIVGIVYWATTTMISGAVIAAGQTVVHGKPRVVQTLDGGEIAEILVRNGDRVTAGQVLLRLDPTLAKVNLDISRTRLAEALAQRARLEAEQLGLEAPVFTYPDLPFDRPDTTLQEQGQREIFAARAEVLRGQRERLKETDSQVQAQIRGLEGQIKAVKEQLDLLAKDREKISGLVEQGLARQAQLSELQRSEADLTGRLAGLEADLSRSRTAIRDAELETLQGERAFKESVVTELREVTASIEELTLDIVNRTAQLGRMDLRSPADGIVHQMQATTVGGVLAPGATILEVVPVGEGLDFELRLDPRAVDQVLPGQRAKVVFSGLPRHETPELHGQITAISPGVVTDPASGQHYYRVDLSIPPEELRRLGDQELVPGMPVEAFLDTGEHSVMNYLLQPLTAEFRRAFREN
ncbi:MAG: HlyD family type I secretion periplasmic adaptor subunit [Pseudomonadota bacterium]